MLLSIDPGAFAGWALFDGTLLIQCGLVTPGNWAYFVDEPPWSSPVNVLIEEPTLYPHSKANPASVMALQLKVGELKGRFEAVGCKVELVEPRTWKHSVPKHIHHARAAKVLNDAERALVANKRHDVWDAVCLGLWKLKRMR